MFPSDAPSNKVGVCGGGFGISSSVSSVTFSVDMVLVSLVGCPVDSCSHKTVGFFDEMLSFSSGSSTVVATCMGAFDDDVSDSMLLCLVGEAASAASFFSSIISISNKIGVRSLLRKT